MDQVTGFQKRSRKRIMKYLKWSLRTKIIFWFITIILIAIILYGFLIFLVYHESFKGENYFNALKDQPGVDQALIDRIREFDKPEMKRIPPPITILPSHLFMRIFYIITGGVLFIIIVSASGGFVLLMRMLKRVNFITTNVREIDEKRLHLRLNLKGRDAISNMARTFDSMLDKIETSFKNHKQFIQDVSHELNTPLTVIKTKIDALKQKKNISGSECKETMELIDSEIMRLARITEELLILTNLEENQGYKDFNLVNVREILKRLLKLFNNQISSKNLKLKTEFKGRSDIFGNKTHLEQLLFNLINNAVKYSRTNSDLEIILKNDINLKNLIISITNSSDCINKEEVPYIFDRFFKSENGKGSKGFGLGLSISKKIVEDLKGSIKAHFNQEEKTITFTIYLPLAKK